MYCDWSKYEDIFWSRCSAEKWTERVNENVHTTYITEGWIRWGCMRVHRSSNRAAWGYTEVVQPRFWRNVYYAESTTESTKCMQREDNHINISNVGPMLAKVCIQMFSSELGQSKSYIIHYNLAHGRSDHSHFTNDLSHYKSDLSHIRSDHILLNNYLNHYKGHQTDVNHWSHF